MKRAWHIIFVLIGALAVLFGLGTLLFTDAVLLERVLIAGAAIGVYVFLSYLYRKIVLK